MKKILFSLMSFILCAFMAQAQTWGVVQGQVVDANQNPVPGVSVFVYGAYSSYNFQNKKNYESNRYTNGNGFYSGSYNNVTVGDSVMVGVIDCNDYLRLGWAVITKPNDSVQANIQIPCVPTACDALVTVDSMYWSPAVGALFQYTAASLRDSNFAAINTPVTHTWSYNGITRTTTRLSWEGPNEDTLWIFSNTNPGPVCYQRMTSCAPICVGTTPTPTGHSCNADFFVDSVNSINFNGQIVVWENSTTDAGASIIGYRWDFGDGSATVNQQYPSHTYNDTGVYQVCLMIVSVAQTATGMDTCTSTYCDSIGFDSNGNLIYKSSGQGFTINVVDPATVGQKEIGLESKFNLFPNPTQGEATLAWEASIGVEQIDVISINGQLIRSIAPNTSSIKLNGLETGVYILRVKSEQGETAVRMMVQ
ncbi:PKD domain-containing protein [Owenweeksia hongkongensis]|uniref:PKD domain-containing protein n=1 Tax=Owenweeksia hongkongensis TaxID=253245 RepID=UPI003A8F32ED